MTASQRVHIDPEILRMRFVCDYRSCRGACCTAPGGSGPPITPEEVAILHDLYPVVESLLPPAHKEIIARDGMIDSDGRGLHIRCVNSRACVFVCYDKGVAQCAIHRAYLEGRLDWPKPLSCHLFPIRVKNTRGCSLVYEEFDECGAARAKGEAEDTALIVFLREPLIRAFGEDWYSSLVKSLHIDDGRES